MSRTFTPNATDLDLSSRFLTLAKSTKVPESPRLVVGGQAIELPPQVAMLFNRIFEDFSSGKSVTIISHDAKLTTQQAADHLGVSRPTLIKLLEKYEVPVETVGRHRRIDFGSVENLRSQLKSTQRSILRNLRNEEIAQGFYDSTDHAPVIEN